MASLPMHPPDSAPRAFACALRVLGLIEPLYYYDALATSNTTQDNTSQTGEEY